MAASLPSGATSPRERMGRADIAGQFAVAAAEQHRACPLYRVASLSLFPPDRYPVGVPGRPGDGPCRPQLQEIHRDELSESRQPDPIGLSAAKSPNAGPLTEVAGPPRRLKSTDMPASFHEPTTPPTIASAPSPARRSDGALPVPPVRRPHSDANGPPAQAAGPAVLLCNLSSSVSTFLMRRRSSMRTTPPFRPRP